MNQQNQFETNNPINQRAIQSTITENSAVAESLSDLPLTGEQAEVTKAGPASGGGHGAGKVAMRDFSFTLK